MTTKLDGRQLASKLYEKIRGEVAAHGGRRPGLTVVQVGENPASSSYIRQKQNAAESCGFRFEHVQLPRELSFEELKRVLTQRCADPAVDGLILQLPLDSTTITDPKATEELLALIPPAKDADGLHTENLGRLLAGESLPERWTSPLPATALGVMRILEEGGVELVGKRAVVVGKSRLVGLPTATLLAHAGATVTVCHSKTKDLARHTREAEVLVAAAGRRHLITPDHVAAGAVVVDVGIHELPRKSADAKRQLTGDVDPAAFAKASLYTPVPGGVGPMTVAGLLENVFRLYRKRGPGL